MTLPCKILNLDARLDIVAEDIETQTFSIVFDRLCFQKHSSCHKLFLPRQTVMRLRSVAVSPIYLDNKTDWLREAAKAFAKLKNIRYDFTIAYAGKVIINMGDSRDRFPLHPKKATSQNRF